MKPLSKILPVLSSILLLVISSHADFPALRPGMAQLGAPLEWLPIPGEQGLHHLIQRTQDDRLILSPNEGFFPKLGLTAEGEGTIPDTGGLNKGTTFSQVTGWDTGDVMEWAVWLPDPGNITLTIHLTDSSQKGRFTISLGNQSKSITPSADSFQWTTRTTQSGFHLVQLTCEQTKAKDIRFHSIHLTGDNTKTSAVLRKRWRPAAAHTRFSTPKATDNVRLWIMEMDAAPGDLDFYAPITTPFGYYGPSWNADGTVKPSINFSLWSYGRGKPEPPIEQLSHLLAIGNPDARFSGFGHEGTGVKIRDWNPFEGLRNQRQAFALRVEPGNDYNTFYSYFYSQHEKAWKLFGAGRKWAKGKPIDHLWVGSFVEVPGPPQRQRTGSTVRRMNYRGWVSKTGLEWHALTTMKKGDIDKETGLTYTDRGLTRDNWFYMETGGWIYRNAPGTDIEHHQTPQPRPEYLHPDKTKALTSTPSTIQIKSVRKTASGIKLTYDISNAGPQATVTAYHGPEEGLTLLEKWSSNTPLTSAREGSNRTTINLPSSTSHIRLLLKNQHGQFWTHQTTKLP